MIGRPCLRARLLPKPWSFVPELARAKSRSTCSLTFLCLCCSCPFPAQSAQVNQNGTQTTDWHHQLCSRCQPVTAPCLGLIVVIIPYVATTGKSSGQLGIYQVGPQNSNNLLETDPISSSSSSSSSSSKSVELFWKQIQNQKKAWGARHIHLSLIGR